MMQRFQATLFLSTVLLLSGCGPVERDVNKEKIEAMTGEEMQETIPVKGKVTIDGEPAAGVNLYAYEAGTMKEAVAQVRTGADGTYCWTKYQPCDGLPAGEYKITFTNIPEEGKGKKEGEDLFKGKYKDPSKSEHTLTVKAGAPQENVDYDLKP